VNNCYVEERCHHPDPSMICVLVSGDSIILPDLLGHAEKIPCGSERMQRVEKFSKRIDNSCSDTFRMVGSIKMVIFPGLVRAYDISSFALLRMAFFRVPALVGFSQPIRERIKHRNVQQPIL